MSVRARLRGRRGDQAVERSAAQPTVEAADQSPDQPAESPVVGQAEPTGRLRGGRRVRRAASKSASVPRIRVPHGLASWRFAVLLGGLLALGMVALLTVNTSLAGGAIALGGLNTQLARTTEAQQALQSEVDALAAPFTLQQAAAELGLVPAGAPIFLDTETGRLTGQLDPVSGYAKPAQPGTQVTVPEPTPSPTRTATPSPAPGADGRPVPPDGVQTTPTPEPLPELRGDGARLSQPTPAATPTPTPSPTPAGDGATIVPFEVQ